jgi:hypothetical protein
MEKGSYRGSDADATPKKTGAFDRLRNCLAFQSFGIAVGDELKEVPTD